MFDQIRLEYIKIETLPANTQCFQLDNGSIVYFKSIPPQKLYARSKGCEEVGAEFVLPRDKIVNVDAQGDAIHFITEFGSIFKATVTPMNTVHVKFVRELNSLETLEALAPLCTRVRDQVKHVYRLGNNPDGNYVIDTRYNANGGLPKAIHRNKLITVRCRSLQFAMKTKSVHRIHELNRTALAIELPLDFGACRVFAEDSSPIIFVSKFSYIFAFNTETMGAQPMITIRGITNISIVGVSGGVITLTGKRDGVPCLVTAPVPEAEFKSSDTLDSAPGYYYTSMQSKMSEFLSKKPIIGNDLRNKMTNPFGKSTNGIIIQDMNDDQKNRQAMKREVDYSYFKKPEYYNPPAWNTAKELGLIPSKKAKVCEPDSDQDDVYTKYHESNSFRDKVLAHPENEWQFEFNGTINDLLDKNSELAKQIERQCNHKVENHHSINHFNNTNNELEETNSQQEHENRYANENLQQKQILNDEIEAANNQLSEEHEMLIKEVEKNEKRMNEKIKYLREMYSKLTLERDNKIKLRNVSVSAKNDLVNKLELLTKENNRLVNALNERRSQHNIKNILNENEQKMNEINLK